jgi:hypothetical protein
MSDSLSPAFASSVNVDRERLVSSSGSRKCVSSASRNVSQLRRGGLVGSFGVLWFEKYRITRCGPQAIQVEVCVNDIIMIMF